MSSYWTELLYSEHKNIQGDVNVREGFCFTGICLRNFIP